MNKKIENLYDKLQEIQEVIDDTDVINIRKKYLSVTSKTLNSTTTVSIDTENYNQWRN